MFQHILKHLGGYTTTQQSTNLIRPSATRWRLLSKIGQSPEGMSSSTVSENQRNYTAMHYVYEIEGKRYTITVVNDRIRQIEWVSINH